MQLLLASVVAWLLCTPNSWVLNSPASCGYALQSAHPQWNTFSPWKSLTRLIITNFHTASDKSWAEAWNEATIEARYTIV